MGAWGDANERRADRMPKLRVQVADSQSQAQAIDQQAIVKEAMMSDLGLARVEDLPLDNTHHERHIPQRARRAPVIHETSEALNGYLAMAKDGLDDDEAMGVRGLNDLGGPCVYRPSAGPARDFTETRRPNQEMFRSMKVSSNGILLPPGAEIRVFQPTNANPQGEVRVIHPMRGPSRAAAPQAAIAPVVQATQVSVKTEENSSQKSSKALPPHLMRKRTTEISSPAGPAPKVQKIQTESPAPIKAQETQTSGNDAASGMTDGPSKDSVNQTQPVVAKLIVSEDQATHDCRRWSAACSAAIGGQWKDAIVELKLENENHPDGQALFVIIFQEVPFKRHSHNLKGHKLAFHKGIQCIVTFGSSGSTIRYNLKFGSEDDAKNFLSMAEMLQQVIEYVQNVSSICGEASKIASKSEASSAPISQEAASSSSEGVAQEMAAAGPKAVTQETDLIIPEVEVSQTLDKMTGMEDAFGKLSLDKVKVSSMYNTDRSDTTTRLQYTAQELFDQRGSAEAPPGIRDVQIPLRQELNVRMPSRPQQGQQRAATPSPQVTRNTTTFLQDWIAGGSASQAKTESSQRVASKKDVSTDLDTSLTSNLIDIEAEGEAETAPAQTMSSDDTIKGTAIVKTEVEESSRDGTTVVGESFVSWETAKSEHTAESAVVVDKLAPASYYQEKTAQATDTSAQNTPVAIPASASNQAPIDRKASVSDATDQSAQTTPAVSAAMGPNPLFAPSAQHFQAPSVLGMPPALVSPQMSHPMGAQPMAYHPQMLQMLPGWQHLPPPPPGKVHAVSVTWHVSSEESPAGEQPSMYNTTTQVNTHGHGPAFSPAAQPFQPCQQNQASSTGPRIRRGLESSMFATGWSGAKYAGSFTGGTNFQ